MGKRWKKSRDPGPAVMFPPPREDPFAAPKQNDPFAVPGQKNDPFGAPGQAGPFGNPVPMGPYNALPAGGGIVDTAYTAPPRFALLAVAFIGLGITITSIGLHAYLAFGVLDGVYEYGTKPFILNFLHCFNFLAFGVLLYGIFKNDNQKEKLCGWILLSVFGEMAFLILYAILGRYTRHYGRKAIDTIFALLLLHAAFSAFILICCAFEAWYHMQYGRFI